MRVGEGTLGSELLPIESLAGGREKKKRKIPNKVRLIQGTDAERQETV
jgi:hypothetical protein